MAHPDRNGDARIERQARQRVGMKIGFSIHALVYVLVNGGLYVLNATAGGPRWALWPALGWGLGLTIHGLVTAIALGGGGVRERMVASEVERLRARR